MSSIGSIRSVHPVMDKVERFLAEPFPALLSNAEFDPITNDWNHLNLQQLNQLHQRLDHHFQEKLGALHAQYTLIKNCLNEVKIVAVKQSPESTPNTISDPHHSILSMHHSLFPIIPETIEHPDATTNEDSSPSTAASTFTFTNTTNSANHTPTTSSSTTNTQCTSDSNSNPNSNHNTSPCTNMTDNIKFDPNPQSHSDYNPRMPLKPYPLTIPSTNRTATKEVEQSNEVKQMKVSPRAQPDDEAEVISFLAQMAHAKQRMTTHKRNLGEGTEWTSWKSSSDSNHDHVAGVNLGGILDSKLDSNLGGHCNTSMKREQTSSTNPEIAMPMFPCTPIKQEHLNLPILPSPSSASNLAMDLDTLSTNLISSDFNFASLPQIKLDPYRPLHSLDTISSTDTASIPALYPSLPITQQNGRKGLRNKHQCMSFVVLCFSVSHQVLCPNRFHIDLCHILLVVLWYLLRPLSRMQLSNAQPSAFKKAYSNAH